MSRKKQGFMSMLRKLLHKNSTSSEVQWEDGRPKEQVLSKVSDEENEMLKLEQIARAVI